MSDNKILASRLSAARKENNYTQEDIAEFLNCGRATVTNYENGRRSPDYDTLIKLAKKYNVTTDYLLGLTGAETTDKDIRYICDYTGLSVEAVERLNRRCVNSKNYKKNTVIKDYWEDKTKKEVLSSNDFRLMSRMILRESEVNKNTDEIYLNILDEIIKDDEYGFSDILQDIESYLDYMQNERNKLHGYDSYMLYKTTLGLNILVEKMLLNRQRDNNGND